MNSLSFAIYAQVHGDIVGSMKTVTAETKRLEMPAPEQFVEVLKRQQTWAKKTFSFLKPVVKALCTLFSWGSMP